MCWRKQPSAFDRRTSRTGQFVTLRLHGYSTHTRIRDPILHVGILAAVLTLSACGGGSGPIYHSSTARLPWLLTSMETAKTTLP